MSRQARTFEAEPFLQFEMGRGEDPFSDLSKPKKVYIGETDNQRQLREKKEQAEKDNCFTNCCNNLTLRDIILCKCIWNTCDLDTANCDCAPEKCCSGCGDACSGT